MVGVKAEREHKTHMTDARQLLQRQDGALLVLTLNAIATRNALSEAMIAALHGAIEQAAADKSVAAVVLEANGTAFSAGHDLKELTARRRDTDGGRAYFTDIMKACAAMMQADLRFPQPGLAPCEGARNAACCQPAARCALAIAGGGARLPIRVELRALVALSRNVSSKHAMEMLLLGDMVDAQGAARIGLVNKVVAAGTATPEALAWAGVIAAKSPLTVAIGKEAFYRQLELSLPDAYALTAEVMVRNMMARDAEEGIGAFIEKRKPEWTGC